MSKNSQKYVIRLYSNGISIGWLKSVKVTENTFTKTGHIHYAKRIEKIDDVHYICDFITACTNGTVICGYEPI